MLALYSGTPGSGKSLHAAERMYYWLRLGKPIIANFEIKTSMIKMKRGRRCNFDYFPNDFITPDKLIEYSKDYFAGQRVREGAILLIIDEAQLLFNAREWDAKGRKEWLSFYTQHRHYGYDIILIAQFDRMIDRQVRSLIEYEYVHRKVSNFGIVGKVFSLFAFGNLFVSVKVWYPLKEKVGDDWYRGKRQYYQLYNTFSDLSTGGKLEESAEKNGTSDSRACVLGADGDTGTPSATGTQARV